MEIKKFNKKIVPDMSKRGLISLLGNNDGVEIMQFDIKKGSFLLIKPSLVENAYEFYYLVAGHLETDDTPLLAGDYFEVQNLKESFSFTAVEDSTLLLFSSRTGEYDVAQKLHSTLNRQLESIQNKDHYTYQHSKNVKKICSFFAKKLKLNADDTRHILLAANFHDIGKIKIPDEILNKSEALTADEYEVMKSHVKHSYEIISREMGTEIAEIILMHHERLDGSGYPSGLKEEDIPIASRILALADSFDAMTTDRVYKKAKSHEDSIAELRSMSSTHYDPALIDLLEELIQSPAFEKVNLED